MDQAYREVLVKNVLQFVEMMVNVQKVVPYLLGEGVLSESMVADIMSNETEEDKARDLHRRIPIDQSAFEIYYLALRQTQNHDLADILEPHIAIDKRIPRESATTGGATGHTSFSKQPEQDDTDKAKTLPDHNDVKVKKCDVNDTEMQKLFNDDEDVYSMKGRTTGVRVLIINNKTFHGKAERDGTNKDATDLHELFKGLGYQSVKTECDLNVEKIQEVLKNEALKCKDSDNAFICVILSHGNTGMVYGSDGKPVKIKALYGPFTGEKCPAMAGKPKIFFIQACQGEKQDGADKQDKGDNFEELEKQFKDLSIDVAKTDSCGKNHTMADILVSFSSTEGYESWRDPIEGTWYIQELVHVISNFAFKHDLLTILTKVQKRIGNRVTSKLGYKQCPETRHTFRKSFNFFPGFE